MLQRGRKILSGCAVLDEAVKTDVAQLMGQAIEHFDLEQTNEMSKVIGRAADRLRLHFEHIGRGAKANAAACEGAPTLAGIRTCLEGIGVFLKSKAREETVQQWWIFLVVCLAQAMHLVAEYDKEQRPNGR